MGDGHLKNPLISTIQNAQFQDYVHFTGKLPYADVPQYYKMADIYVIPSEFEGTSKSLLEAMHNQLPIIATDVTGINNILTHKKHALLFEKATPNNLKTELRFL